MSDGVLSVPTLCTIKQLKDAINAHHAAFPVTNTANRLVGLIPRSMLIILGKERAFYDKSLIQNQAPQAQAETENMITEQKIASDEATKVAKSTAINKVAPVQSDS